MVSWYMIAMYPCSKDLAILFLDLIIQIGHQHADMRTHLEEVRNNINLVQRISQKLLHPKAYTVHFAQKMISRT